MKCDPIFCSGNELASVLADIRAKGGFIESLDTCFGGKNAQYGVNYFETFPHKPHDASSGTMQSQPDLARTVKGVRQVAGHITTKTSVAAGNDKRAEKPKSVMDAPASISDDVTSHGGSIEPQTTHGSVKSWRWKADDISHQSERRDGGDGRENKSDEQDHSKRRPINFGSVAVKAGAGSSRTPLRQLTACEGANPSTPDPFTHQGKTAGVAPSNRPDCVETAHLGSRDDLSIASRLATLQSKLTAAGKIKQVKPSTPREHARLPHKND